MAAAGMPRLNIFGLPDAAGLTADLRARAIAGGLFDQAQITALDARLASLPAAEAARINTFGRPFFRGCLNLALFRTCSKPSEWVERLCIGCAASVGQPLLDQVTGRVFSPSPSFGNVPPTMDAQSTVAGGGALCQHEIKETGLKLRWYQINMAGVGPCMVARVHLSFTTSRNQMQAFTAAQITLPDGTQVPVQSAFVCALINGEEEPFFRISEVTAQDIVTLGVGFGPLQFGWSEDYRVTFEVMVTQLVACVQLEWDEPGVLRTPGGMPAQAPLSSGLAQADELPLDCPPGLANLFYQHFAGVGAGAPRLSPVADACF
mmetsp:Transcript_22984/g.75072  ORF Transcript_22984/g.75072 Transcript_22984/m.75072 type:complete len:319 (+) Transcript_22984:58-1014(+)